MLHVGLNKCPITMAVNEETDETEVLGLIKLGSNGGSFDLYFAREGGSEPGSQAPQLAQCLMDKCRGYQCSGRG